jgi:hypothetical protein
MVTLDGIPSFGDNRYSAKFWEPTSESLQDRFLPDRQSLRESR